MLTSSTFEDFKMNSFERNLHLRANEATKSLYLKAQTKAMTLKPTSNLSSKIST